jgi:hypothetical protein
MKQLIEHKTVTTTEVLMETIVTIEVSRRPGGMGTVGMVDSQGTCVMVKRVSPYSQFQAKIKGGRWWGCGNTRKEAIGDLLMSHPEKFGIEIDYA